MDEIRGNPVFRDLIQISFDNSGTLSGKDREEKISFGHSSNLQIMWEYCSVSKADIELSPGILDDGDLMRLEDFNLLMNFYNSNKTLKVSDEDLILEVFKYFVGRDMILEASLMQANLEGLEEGTLLQEEEEVHNDVMETESFLHDNEEFDKLSNAELFYRNYKGKEPKDVWAAFEIFETNSIDMSKLDNLIFQKSKDFFTLEKRKGCNIKCFGLLFTEEDMKTH